MDCSKNIYSLLSSKNIYSLLTCFCAETDSYNEDKVALDNIIMIPMGRLIPEYRIIRVFLMFTRVCNSNVTICNLL